MTPCSEKLDPLGQGDTDIQRKCFKLLDSNVWTLYASLSSLLKYMILIFLLTYENAE